MEDGDTMMEDGDTIMEDGDTMMEDGDVNKDMIISYEQMMLGLRISLFGIIPVISIFGIVGQIFSIIILYKHGLHKSSNILLISLAVSDFTYLVSVNSVPKSLYNVVGIGGAFEFSQQASYVLFVFYKIFNVLDYSSGSVSFTMPMLITFERLIAVYLPFSFKRIVTPTRTWCAVAFVYLSWFSCVTYTSFWLGFTYTFDPQYNVSFGLLTPSALFLNNLGFVETVTEVLPYFILRVPPAVTFVGCFFIFIKVRMASRQRKKMMQVNSKDSSHSSSANRTTKMLLAVCAVYMVTSAIVAFPQYVPDLVQFDILSEPPNNLSPVIMQLLDMATCINSSSNFLVYIIMNKKFRETYLSLFTCCRERKH